jgi:RNA polymerase sigma factor (sigma-70 family)
MAEKSLVQLNIQNFDEVWNDKFCRAIIHGLINKYSSSHQGYIDHDDVVSFAMQATWEATQKYDTSYNVKFTTYLSNMIRYKLSGLSCRQKERYQKFAPIYKNKVSTDFHDISDDIGLTSQEKEKISNSLRSLSDGDRSIIIDKFFGRMTNKEIADKHGWNNQESIRLHIKEIIGRMKED